MKILSIIVAHPLRKVSGATNAGLELSAATAERVDLEVAVMWDADEVQQIGKLKRRNFSCHSRMGFFERFVPRFVRVPLFDSNISSLIKPGAYDIVHLHNLVPTLAAERLAKACQRARIPYVISTHGFVELSQYAKINGFGPIKSWLIGWVMTRPFHRIVAGAKRIFALSDCERELLGSLGVREDQIDVVTNGVNPFFLIDPSPAEMEAIRSRFIKVDGPVLLFMGSLHAYKGVGTFLASLEKLSGPFQAIVAGRFKDPNEPAKLMDKAGVPQGLRGRIVFTGGVSNDELRALYHTADVFVYPTAGDTLPLVVLEAMACARPVVSTTVGGIPFEVTPDCGLLVKPDDAGAVAAAVATLLASPEQRRSMGQAARARVLSTFSWHKSAQAAEQAYQRALA